MADLDPAYSEDEAIKQRALRRLVIALALIAAAIVGLALLDRYSGKLPVPERPSTEPEPVAALPAPKPVRPAPEATSPPTTQPPPALPPPPPPVVSNEPLAPPAAKPGQPTREQTAAPEVTRSPSKATPAEATASTAAPVPEHSGFVVQTGVFTSQENATALHAKLQEQGIPSYLETRVVVGPFRNRAQAEAAVKRLRALGLSGLVSQRK